MNTSRTISSLLNEAAKKTEAALAIYLNTENIKYPCLNEAMRYSVLSGGKRIRPFLTLSFCRLFGGDEKSALPFACAIEMVHAFSLIHDDLPCMDNDDLRRGRPTNHKVFGEANALLAGDALLNYAFEVVAGNGCVSPSAALEAVSVLSQGTGTEGMIGGQVLDLIGETASFDLETLKYLHSRKTGALIKAACRLGCIAAGAGADECAAADAYAGGIGLAFQIIDDILDCVGDEATLGKPVGSDRENGKTTFLTFMSVEDAYKAAGALTADAKKAIERFENSETLCQLADYLFSRKK